MKHVLDASALLRFTDEEIGFERVENLIKDARRGNTSLSVSSVNWSEVAYVFRKRLSAHEFEIVLDNLKRLPFAIVDLDVPLAEAAAALRSKYKIPFADSFAAALAHQNGATLVTADFDFKAIADEGVISAQFLPPK